MVELVIGGGGSSSSSSSSSSSIGRRSISSCSDSSSSSSTLVVMIVVVIERTINIYAYYIQLVYRYVGYLLYMINNIILIIFRLMFMLKSTS